MSADLSNIPQMIQLKKANFLEAVPTDEPVTRGGLVDLLEAYDFIDSWLTFLIDHFMAQNKIIEGTDEDGNTTYVRKAAKGAAAREAFLVEFDEDEDKYIVTSRKLDKGETINKDDGERTTRGAAIKAATSAVFAQYKADTALIRELVEVASEAE